MKKMLAIFLLFPVIWVLASCARAFVAFSPVPARQIFPAARIVPPPSVASPPPSAAPLYQPQGMGGWTFLSVDGGFKTSGDAIRYFTDCLKRNDFPDAVKAFPVRVLAGKYAYLVSSERPRVAYMAGARSPLPHTGLDAVKVLGQAAAVYRSALLGLEQEALPAGAAHSVKAPGLLPDLSVSVADAGAALPDAMMAKYRGDMAALAGQYGADAAGACSVTLRAHGNEAVCDALTLVRYGDGWYIVSGVFAPQK